MSVKKSICIIGKFPDMGQPNDSPVMISVVSLNELINIHINGYTDVTAQIPNTTVNNPRTHLCLIFILSPPIPDIFLF